MKFCRDWIRETCVRIECELERTHPDFEGKCKDGISVEGRVEGAWECARKRIHDAVKEHKETEIGKHHNLCWNDEEDLLGKRWTGHETRKSSTPWS